MVALGAFCIALGALARLAETLAPKRSARCLFALLILPALLSSVLSELPSLLDAYAHWLTASVGLVNA